MTRSITRCSFCPAAGKQTHNKIITHPRFVDEAMDWPPSDPGIQGQWHALREAIAPYLCIADLRRLAASGENIQAALKSIEGIPEEVQALVSLLQVLLAPRADERITQPADLAALLMLEMGHLDHEEFWLACLDTKNHVQRLHRLYKGSLNSSIVYVMWNLENSHITCIMWNTSAFLLKSFQRMAGVFHIMRVCELFRLPLQLNSAAIIVAHNHPSSSVQVSPEDIDVTRILIQAGELLEIEVLDHLIIGQGRWMSMREQGLCW
jgi:DNA repair protein RadC